MYLVLQADSLTTFSSSSYLWPETHPREMSISNKTIKPGRETALLRPRWAPRTLPNSDCFTSSLCLAVSVWFCNLSINLHQRQEIREIDYYTTRTLRSSLLLKPFKAQRFQYSKWHELLVRGSWWDGALLWLLRTKVYNQRVIEWETSTVTTKPPTERVRQEFKAIINCHVDYFELFSETYDVNVFFVCFF